MRRAAAAMPTRLTRRWPAAPEAAGHAPRPAADASRRRGRRRRESRARPRTCRPTSARAAGGTWPGRAPAVLRVRTDAAADCRSRGPNRADAVTIGADVSSPRRAVPAATTARASPCWRTRRAHVTALLGPGRARAAGRRWRASRRGGGAALAGRDGWRAAIRPGACRARDHTSAPAGTGQGPGGDRAGTATPAGQVIRAPAGCRSSASATSAAPRPQPMRAEVDRRRSAAPAAFDLEALRRSLIDDLMRRLRTDFERGG